MGEGDWMQLRHPGKIMIAYVLYSKDLSQKVEGQVTQKSSLAIKPD
jgi:hypothetical protein